ncbi:MAG: DUF192 domain-containing protein [Nitrososphaeraceae archaeon]
MVHKAVVLLPPIIAASIIGSLGIFFASSEVKDRDLNFPFGTIKIDNDTIRVEVAKSNVERQRWLTFRDEPIPLGSAMLLIYERLDLYALWLINIQYYLDLVWFNENGEWYMQEKTRSSEKSI